MAKKNTNVNLNIFAIGFLIIALAIGYYFVIFLPSKQNAELKLKEEEAKATSEQEQDIQRQIDTCLHTAHRLYISNWNSICEIDGKEDDCLLPRYRSEPIEADYKDARDECIDRYK